jgi:hypothetical protein
VSFNYSLHLPNTMVLTFIHRVAGVQAAVPNGAIVLNTPIVLNGLQAMMIAPAPGVVQANFAVVQGAR